MKKYLVSKFLKQIERFDDEILKNQQFPEDVYEIKDIPYIDDGNSGHLLDVYYPKGANEPLPIIIVIHGGGFLYGDKKYNRSYGYHLAKRGFIIFNINYRLAMNDAKVPGQIQDVVSAINWISDNIGSYPAYRSKVFIAGDSVGGMLGVMVTLMSKSERFRHLFKTPPISLDIKALAINCGMMCVNESKLYYRGWRSMCFDKGYKNQEYYQSMIFDKVPEIKYLPPVFITSGDDDELSRMTLYFVEILLNNNIKYKLKYFDNTEDKRLGHVFSIQHPEYDESKEIVDDMLKLFEEALDK